MYIICRSKDSSTCRLIKILVFTLYIGVGEVVTRIIAKAVLSIIGPDIQCAAGNLQFCAGQSSGVDAAIHCMRTVFSDKNSVLNIII